MVTQKPHAARRGKGRPARGQPGVGRETMIAATSELLKKRSPENITRAELARKAGIDPALIRYYFGDMSSLVLQAHPHLHELLMQPVLHVEPVKSAEMEALRREYTLASFDTLRSILARAQDNAESIETDVRMFYVVVIGMAEFAVRCFQYFELLSVRQGSRTETLARFTDYVADLLIDGLRPRG